MIKICEGQWNGSENVSAEILKKKILQQYIKQFVPLISQMDAVALKDDDERDVHERELWSMVRRPVRPVCVIGQTMCSV